MWKVIFLCAAGGLAASLAAYVTHEQKCLHPSENIISENQAIDAIKRNTAWFFTDEHKENYENIENYKNPIVSKAGKPGNGWGVSESQKTSPKMRVWNVFYFEDLSNGGLEIECEVACGYPIEGQCLKMNNHKR